MRYIIALTAALISSTAYAAPWKIDPENSTLTFTATQAGEAFTGKFTRFTPVVEFDPHNTAEGHITVTVDMASAVIDDKDKQESLPTRDWFDTATFPTATFESKSINKTGANDFAAAGTLTIKGVSMPLALPFRFIEKDGLAFADGSIELNRQKFNIGLGQWKDDKWIAYPVTVNFHLQATHAH